MRLGILLVRGGVLLAVIAVAGCGKTEGGGKENRPPRTAGDLLPALDDTPTALVLEAEDGRVVAPFRVEPFSPTRHEKSGVLQKASGGKCVAIPDGVNPKDKNKKPPYEGRLVLSFTVPKDGRYYIYPRTWWLDGCGNSFLMKVDNGRDILVTGSTEKAWTWVTLERRTALGRKKPGKTPRAFPLKKGPHTLTFLNREDGPKIDQVYITDDPHDKPTGIMTKPD